MANIDYILENTGFSQVHTYSYSYSGTSLAFSIALYPEYFSERLVEVTLVAGPVNLAHTDNFGFIVLADYPIILNSMLTVRFIEISTFFIDNFLLFEQ